MSTPPEAWQQWFAKIWAHREERIYRAFFGDLNPRVQTIPRTTFEALGAREVDPRWLTHGVLESPPNARRDRWLYVTTALSNPWGQDPAAANPTEYSGLGMELVLEAPRPAGWAVGVLQWLAAVQILVASGVLEGGLLEPWDRVPLHGPLEAGSALRNLVVAEPLGYPSRFQLESGRVDLLLCVGTTDAEHCWGAEHGGEQLATLLKHRGVFPATDPARASLVEQGPQPRS